MASIVNRPGVKPDCCGRRRAVSSGWSLASSTLANTFPGTDSKKTGGLPHLREERVKRGTGSSAYLSSSVEFRPTQQRVHSSISELHA